MQAKNRVDAPRFRRSYWTAQNVAQAQLFRYRLRFCTYQNVPIWNASLSISIQREGVLWSLLTQRATRSEAMMFPSFHSSTWRGSMNSLSSSGQISSQYSFTTERGVESFSGHFPPTNGPVSRVRSGYRKLDREKSPYQPPRPLVES